MKKAAFLAQLRTALGDLPPEDAARTLEYYGEAIDDRMDDGEPEEEAVAAVGTVEEIRSLILADTPPRPPQRRVLLLLAAPLLLVLAALFIAAAAVFLCAALLAIALSMSAIPALIELGLAWAGLYLGGGMVLTGVSILLFYALRAAAGGIVRLGRNLLGGLRRRGIRREHAI